MSARSVFAMTATLASLALFTLAAPDVANAASAPSSLQATAPAGGGMAALTVTVDLKAGEVRAGSDKIPIALGHSLMPDASATDVVTEIVSIGDGKHVVHVRVPAKGASGAPHYLAWEAVLAAGHAPIFAGVTGFAAGEDGERTGKMIEVRAKDDGTSFVIVARVEESTRICGQALTPLAPEVLNAKALELRGATVQRLAREQRDAATRVIAIAKGAPADLPLARLLVATATSVPNNTGGALTDGNSETAWSEQRPGAGQGEFVLMRAPAEVPLTKIAIVIAPPKAVAGGGASPKSFYLVTDTQTFAVTMPEDAWMHPGAAYEIPLAEPLHATCLTLVLDEAYAREGAHPDVSVAEIYAYSEFDGKGASLETTAAALAGGGARGMAAAGVLKRAGDGALAAVESAFEKLDVQGRQLAADIAVSASSCDASAAILVRAMVDPAPEVSRKGRLKLERCGKSATAGLVQSLRTNVKGRVLVAPMLAMLSPEAALDPLAEVMSDGASDPNARAAVRSGFARASKSATKEKLAALVADTKRTSDARVELLRAATVRIREIAPEANAAIAELLQNAPTMRTRYLLVGPVAELARGGDAMATARLLDLLAHDAEWPVRARAAEASEGMAAAADALAVASRDPEPRVREAALLAMGPSDIAKRAASDRLAHDTWSFVRAAALDALTPLPASPEVDLAIAGALKDPAARVRVASATALGTRHAAAFGGALRARVDDKDEDLDVRVAATRALGDTCHVASVDKLTELARGAASPASDTDVQLGMAAIDALGKLHPVDLAQRLAPFAKTSVPPYAHKMAEQAMEAKGSCR